MKISEALREYRMRNNLRQKEMASKLGITRVFYSLIEESRSAASSKVRKRIFALTGIKEEYNLPPHRQKK